MGANCCVQNKAVSATSLVDLPMPKIPKNDKLAAWELSTPFARCAMKAYMIHLNQAHEGSGGKGVVQLGQLVSQFGTPAWAPLKNSQSDLVKFLTTNLAKGDGIDYQSLVIMGLLHCAD